MRYAGRLTVTLGQPVVVDNVTGASGNIGTAQVARAKPDGYTLMSSVNTLVMNASLFKNLPYDPVADFQPITLTAWGSLVLVAHPSQAPNSVAELVAAAKARPRALAYGSPGIGTPHHLSMALVETATGIELLHVPYLRLEATRSGAPDGPHPQPLARMRALKSAPFGAALRRDRK